MIKKTFFIIITYKFYCYIITFLATNISKTYIASFGKHLKVNSFSKFSPETHLGDGCNFNGITVLGRGKLTIGDNFHSGFNLCIITDTHNWKSNILPYDSTFINGSVQIKKNVWIGINVTILPNVIIGNNVIVGAGSVVTKSIPDNKIVVGNPAKVIKSR